jgi:hypothetical protein
LLQCGEQGITAAAQKYNGSTQYNVIGSVFNAAACNEAERRVFTVQNVPYMIIVSQLQLRYKRQCNAFLAGKPQTAGVNDALSRGCSHKTCHIKKVRRTRGVEGGAHTYYIG